MNKLLFVCLLSIFLLAYNKPVNSVPVAKLALIGAGVLLNQTITSAESAIENFVLHGKDLLQIRLMQNLKQEYLAEKENLAKHKTACIAYTAKTIMCAGLCAGLLWTGFRS